MAELQAQFDNLESQYKQDHDVAHLEAIFHLIDVDHDGVITKQELVAALQYSHGEGAEARATYIIAQADKNADGVVSQAEFIAFMQKSFEA